MSYLFKFIGPRKFPSILRLFRPKRKTITAESTWDELKAMFENAAEGADAASTTGLVSKFEADARVLLEAEGLPTTMAPDEHGRRLPAIVEAQGNLSKQVYFAAEVIQHAETLRYTLTEFKRYTQPADAAAQSAIRLTDAWWRMTFADDELATIRGRRSKKGAEDSLKSRDTVTDEHGKCWREAHATTYAHLSANAAAGKIAATDLADKVPGQPDKGQFAQRTIRLHLEK